MGNEMGREIRENHFVLRDIYLKIEEEEEKRIG